jgi:hypothetical protein
MPISVIRYLKEDELSSPEGVHSLDATDSVTIVEKFQALTESVNVATRAQTKLRHIVLLVKLWLISWNVRF